MRCNACRNVCPACSCVKCVFDNPASGVAAKASADDFEENLFHIIRAFHVAGRCTDCGCVFNVLHNKNTCPQCGSTAWELLGGREFMIKEIVAC